MSAHDSPAQETKGIFALPLVACIVVLLILIFFTRPIFHQGHESSHEKIEAPHTEGAEHQ